MDGRMNERKKGWINGWMDGSVNEYPMKLINSCV